MKSQPDFCSWFDQAFFFFSPKASLRKSKMYSYFSWSVVETPIGTSSRNCRVKSRKPAWFGHVTRYDSLFKTILQGSLEGGRHRGRQRKCWMDIIMEWTSVPMPELLTMASRGKHWKRISAESSLMPPPPLLPPSPTPAPDDQIDQGTELNCWVFIVWLYWVLSKDIVDLSDFCSRLSFGTLQLHTGLTVEIP